MASWYCAIDGQECGPFSTDQLRALAQQGQLRPSDHIRRADSDSWTPAAKVRGLFESASKPQAKAAVPPIAGPAPTVSAGHGVAAGPPIAPTPAPPIAPASAALPTAIPVRPAAAIPVAGVQPMPVATPVAATTTGTRQTARRGAHGDTRPKSKKQMQMVVGGLGATLLLLIVVAVFLLGRPSRDREAAVSQVETDPGQDVASALETDIESNPAAVKADATSARQATTAASRPALPTVGRWSTAGTQKRVVGDLVRLHIPAAWWAPSPSPPHTLVVEVEITNISATRPFEYLGWTADIGASSSEAALLVAGTDAEPIAARSSPDSPVRSVSAERLAPKQAVTKRLQFALPRAPDTGPLRLILPYAALGLPGYAGFEIPAVMILDGPPEAAPPATPVATAPPGGGEAMPNDPTASRPIGEPETVTDLKAQIEAGMGGPASEPVPAQTTVPEEPEPAEPETMEDLRRSIEQDEKPPERSEDVRNPDEP
ncbi:MAG: DUF4339 domain-containing protein [Pirellulaceae bacterium]|nr:DUF4339 domain-containing protein [Pirellulaceae bacterium]